MALPMSRPTKHPKTGVYQIRRRVPQPIQAVIGKAERVISLGTKDPEEAKKRAPAANRKIDDEFASARAALGPARRLSHREITALCGELYKETVGLWEDDPGLADDWLAYADHLYDELERDSETDEPVGPSKSDVADAIRITRAHGIPADQDSLRRLASAMYRTKLKAASTLSRRAEGDYSPDQNLAAFPPVPSPTAADKPQPSATEQPLTAETLLTLWSAEQNPAPATLRAYRGKFRQLTRILGFDDIRRVTPELVVKFKEARLKEGRNGGTVADDVIAMGTLCGWAKRTDERTY